MKILFMGTPEFALPSLEALNRSGDDLLGVVTQPDRPKGRGGLLSPPPIKPAAIKMGCEVYQPEKVRERDFINRIRGLKPDLIVVVAFGQILPKDIIDIPLCGCVNVHASMLPKYRGAAPVNWAIINGDKRTGVTTMMMDAGMDTGPILLQQETEIYEEDTAGSLLRRMSRLGAGLLVETISGIRENRIIPRPQGE
ncbi:MAG: methionyl-tRNA formyltransferase, partial [Nitrospirota bacterium]